MHIPGGENTVVPAQGDIVTAQVTIVTQQFCRCEYIMLCFQKCKTAYNVIATIRRL